MKSGARLRAFCPGAASSSILSSSAASEGLVGRDGRGRKYVGPARSRRADAMGDTGPEPARVTTKFHKPLRERTPDRAAQSGAVAPTAPNDRNSSEAGRLVEMWSHVPDAVRERVLGLIE